MRSKTAWNHYRRLLAMLESSYSRARAFGLSSEELSEARKTVFGDRAYSRLSAEYRSLLSSRCGYLLDSLYAPLLGAQELERILARAYRGEKTAPIAYLRWALFLDGTELVTEEERSEAYRGDNYLRLEGAHIWNHNGKLFSPLRLIMSEERRKHEKKQEQESKS